MTATRRETLDVVSLEMDPGEEKAFAFEPGQFNMLYAFGVGEVPVSISSSRDGPHRITHTIRDVGAVTHALCSLAPGDDLGVRGPYGTGWPMRAAEGGDLLIVAGGVGLPPVRPAILEALAHRDRYESISLLYGARTPQDLLYPEELAAWTARPDIEVELTVDATSDGWPGTVGVVPDLIPDTQFDPANTTAFVIGPEVMMRFAIRAIAAAGVTDDRIFLSMERNMKCAVGLCGHCQLGPFFVCRDGAVFRYSAVAPWMGLRGV